MKRRARWEATHERQRGGTIARRFWQRVDKTPGLGPQGTCWEWTGPRLRGRGYGRFSPTRAGAFYAHRVAYELGVGPIPEGLGVLHRCDNPPCVNPAHLSAGTQAQNIQDCLDRGRFKAVVGERSHWAKLGAAQVRDIRTLWTAGLTSRALEARFGISDSQILNIVHRRAWAHVA